MGNKLSSTDVDTNQTAEYLSDFFSKSQRKNKCSSETFIIKWHQKQTNSAINNSIDDLLLLDQRRVVFISLIGLYQTWKITPTAILYSSIFILPLKRKWVQSPKKNHKEIEQHIMGQISLFQDKNALKEFLHLLQWKDTQGLAFWMLDEYEMTDNNDDDGNVLIAPFWKNFNEKLTNLYDPVTKSKYKPVKLDEKWWTLCYDKLVKSKYDVKPSKILMELYFVSMKYQSVQEIIYQSNPDSLHPVKSYQGVHVCSNDKSYLGAPDFVPCYNMYDDESEERSENEGIWMISTDYD